MLRSHAARSRGLAAIFRGGDQNRRSSTRRKGSRSRARRHVLLPASAARRKPVLYNGFSRPTVTRRTSPISSACATPIAPDAIASARISCALQPAHLRFLIEKPGRHAAGFHRGGCTTINTRRGRPDLLVSFRTRTDHDFTDFGTLTVGVGASPSVLNSPQNIGHLPGGQISGVTFALRVDAAR